MSERIENGVHGGATLNEQPRRQWGKGADGMDAMACRSDQATSEPVEQGGDAALRREIGSWGVGLIVLGVLHFLLSGFLDPLWGIVLVLLGVVNLLIRSRGMFVANGIALIVVGLMNIFSGGFGGWSLFGGLQIYWGIKEIAKFGKYAEPASEGWSPDQAKPNLG